MRILAIVKLYACKNKAGGEMYLHHFLKHLKSLGHQISVLIPYSEKIELYEFEGIYVSETDEKNWLDYIEDSDLVITQLERAEETIKECIIRDHKCMYITHGPITPKYIKYVNHPKIIKIFNSNYLKNHYNREWNGIQGDYFILYPYTPDYSEYATTDLKYRQFITFVNPCPFKGSDLFYELVERMPDKKFMVVEGGYYPELQRLERHYPNLVIQKNTQDMVNDVYLKSRIVLQPSRVESYGMVASEACSMGIPTIVNKLCEGLKENMGRINLYGTTHEKLTEGDIQSYIDCIRSLDNQHTYILWSNHELDHSENRRNEIENQMTNIINYINNI